MASNKLNINFEEIDELKVSTRTRNHNDGLPVNSVSSRNTKETSTYILQKQVQGKNRKLVKCVDSNEEVNCEEIKRKQNLKRKRHIKKSFSRHINDGERTSIHNSYKHFLSNRHLDMLLNIVVAIVVSFIVCGGFSVLLPRLANKDLHLKHDERLEASQQTLENTKSINRTNNLCLNGRKCYNKLNSPPVQNIPGKSVIFETIRESTIHYNSNERMSYRSPIASFVRTLDFERAIINEGKGMDPFTGKFTAPVNGVYIFYFSGTARSSTYLQVFTMKTETSVNHLNELNELEQLEDKFPKLQSAVELPTVLSSNQSNNFNDEKSGHTCKTRKGASVSHMFVQRLIENEQLWLAVVLEHFYVTTATPLKLIGFLQTT